MEPFSLLLGVFVLLGAAKVGVSATSDAYATVKAAQAGAWDVIDRQRERRASFWQRVGAAWAIRRRARHQAAGGSGEFRPGARAYAADVYHGFWEDQLAKRAAKRAARGPFTYDPDRLSWADRFDAAVMRKVNDLRERWGQRVPEPVADTPLGELLDHDEPEPADYEPGTWTVDEQGRRVALAPDTADETDDDSCDTDDHQGVVDALHGARDDERTDMPADAAIQFRQMLGRCAAQDRNAPHDEAGFCGSDAARGDIYCGYHRRLADAAASNRDTEPNGGDTMTAPTQAATAATEIQTNEDARQAFAAISGLAKQAQDALAALEAVVAQMKTATAATTDGMSAKKFDSAAQQAAFEAAEAVDLGDVTEWYGKFEAAQQAADSGLAALAKWLDAESMVASENVDATTLAATSS